MARYEIARRWLPHRTSTGKNKMKPPRKSFRDRLKDQSAKIVAKIEKGRPARERSNARVAGRLHKIWRTTKDVVNNIADKFRSRHKVKVGRRHDIPLTPGHENPMLPEGWRDIMRYPTPGPKLGNFRPMKHGLANIKHAGPSRLPKTSTASGDKKDATPLNTVPTEKKAIAFQA